MNTPSQVSTLAVLIQALCTGAVQGQRIQALAQTDLTPLSGEFVSVTGALGLSSGEVIVLDNAAGTVSLVTANTSRQVGRTGRGPNEYLAPTRVWPWAGDSVAIHDEGNWRFLIVVLPMFRGRTLSLPSSTPLQLRGTDRQGNAYIQGSDFRVGSADSTPLLRLGEGRGVDTLDWLRLPAARPLSEIGGVPIDGIGGALSVFAPFAPGDDWSVSSDGAVAIVRASPFRVEWLLSDRSVRIVGPVLSYRPVPVTDEDRKVLSEEAAGTTLVVPNGSSGRVIKPTQTPTLPKFKPPFVRSETKSDPVGRVWLKGSQGALDSIATYMIIDRKGQLSGIVGLPPRARLIGFAPNSIVLSIPDQDDIEHLFTAHLPR